MSDTAFPPSALIVTANALVTGSPLDEPELRHAMQHFRDLAERLQISGPRFGTAHRDAVDLHNRAVRRLRETRAEREVRERRAAEAADGLIELPAP